MTAKRLYATMLLAMSSTACTVGPDYKPPVATVGETWITPVGTAETEAVWWAGFNDPLLTELVESAIAGNKDLAEAGARLREARANRDAVRGSSDPQGGAVVVATQNRLSENGQLPVGRVPGLGRDLSIFDLGFDASWEIDLWGSSRRANEGAEARVQAADEARRGVVVQVIAEVVRTYIDLRAAQNLEANALTDAAAQQKIAQLAADRLRVGIASRFDLVRAQAQARSTAAVVPEYQADVGAAAFRLALLLGQPPEALYGRLKKHRELPEADIEVKAGLRSELLLRRPDVRQAERDLAASSADIGVATAELFPRISLLGGLGQQARKSGDLFSADSLRFQIGPSLHWPIFSRGRIKAGIRAADARAEAAMVRYERSVLNALSDSETALNRLASARRARVERDDARNSAGDALIVARRRYMEGEDDLTVLLQTQTAFSAADRLNIQARAAELRQATAVYKALGGGWEGFEVAGQKH